MSTHDDGECRHTNPRRARTPLPHVAVLLALALALASLAATAGEGAADGAFGSNGATRVLLGPDGTARGSDRARAVLAADDGSLFVGGYAGAADGRTLVALARLRADGAPDTTFAGTGNLTFGLGGPAGAMNTVTGLAAIGGGALAVGTLDLGGATQRLFATRVRGDGGFEPGFGSGGVLVYQPAAAQTAGLAVLARSGASQRFLVAGEISNGNRDVLLLQFDASGAPDAQFGVAGVARIPVDLAFGASDGALTAIEVDGGTRLLIGGYAVNAQGNLDLLLVRTLADGTPDASFGMAGLVTVDLSNTGEPSSEYVSRLRVLPDGRVALVGTRVVAGQFRSAGVVCVLGVAANLSCRIGLGVPGTTPPQIESVFGLAVDARGRLLVAGVAQGSGQPAGGFVARLQVGALPALDPAWGQAGVASAQFAGVAESSAGTFEDLVLDRRGRAVVVGGIQANVVPVVEDFAVARFVGDGVFADGIE